jgi:hypothetical protein
MDAWLASLLRLPPPILVTSVAKSLHLYAVSPRVPEPHNVPTSFLFKNLIIFERLRHPNTVYDDPFYLSVND